MATMPELLAKLSEREQAKFQVERECKERVREAGVGVMRISEEIMELRRAQEQQIKVLRARCASQLREAGYNKRQEVHNAMQAHVDAEAEAERAEERAKNAERYVKHLEVRLEELEVLVAERHLAQEGQQRGLEKVLESREQRLNAQAVVRKQRMRQHAEEAHDISNAALQVVMDELQAQAGRSHLRAEGRARFRELCELATRGLNKELPGPAYHSTKEDLIQLWHAQREEGVSKLLPTTAEQALPQNATVFSPFIPVSRGAGIKKKSPGFALGTTAPAALALRNGGSSARATPSPMASARRGLASAGLESLRSAREPRLNTA